MLANVIDSTVSDLKKCSFGKRRLRKAEAMNNHRLKNWRLTFQSQTINPNNQCFQMASSNYWRVAVPTRSRLLQIGKLTVIALAATPLLKADEETVVPIPPISSIKSRQQEILQQQHKDTPIFVQIPRMPEGTTQVISAPGEQPRFGVERKRKTFSETADRKSVV